jgi:hypothetical protein
VDAVIYRLTKRKDKKVAEIIKERVERGIRYLFLWLFVFFLWIWVTMLYPEFLIFSFSIFLGLEITIGFSYVSITFEKRKQSFWNYLWIFLIASVGVFLLYLAIELLNGENPFPSLNIP